jgi:voltage-gated potassium channel
VGPEDARRGEKSSGDAVVSAGARGAARAAGSDPGKMTRNAPPRKEPAAGPVDWLLLLLALVSIGLILYLLLGDVSEGTRRLIYGIDFAICVLFAVDFLWRWRGTGWSPRYPLRNWYDVLGMVPVVLTEVIPLLRAFRFVRVVIVLFRLVGIADRVMGDEFAYKMASRFTEPIVMAIKTPITLVVLDEVTSVLRTGHYADNLASALEENRGELSWLVLEKVKHDRQVGRLSILPFHDQIVRNVTDATLRVLLDVLHDPRADELIADFLRESMDQIRLALEDRKTMAAGSAFARGTDDRQRTGATAAGPMAPRSSTATWRTSTAGRRTR